MAMIEANGARLHVDEVGRGHPILFVHELGSDHREWELQVRYFSRSHRCIRFDARGYPPSEVPEDGEAYGYEHAAEDIGAVMRACGVARAHVVGLSMGAYATLQFALRHPEMASAIVVAGVGSGSPPGVHEQWKLEAARMARRYEELGAVAMAEEIGHGPTRLQLLRKNPRAWQEFMAHLREHSVVGMARTIARYQGQRPSLQSFEAQLRRLAVPTLLVVGDEDEPCIETTLFLKRVIPGAGMWMFPRTGHAVNLEEPDRFHAAVDAFFTETERGSDRPAGQARPPSTAESR